MLRPLLPMVLMTCLVGCVNLAPDYQTPEAPIPSQWPAPAAVSEQLPADIGWEQFFTDARLRNTVRLALSNNRDLRIAALDIQKARAEYRITRADLFPSVSSSATGTREHGSSGSSSGSTSSGVSNTYTVELGFSSYEIDVFGRLNNLKDAALQTYLATEETRRSTQISLVAEVASAWLTLASNQQLLALAQQTYTSQQKTYSLVERSHSLGGSSGLELAQARSTVETARADVANYQSEVEQSINALNLLVGASVPDSLLPDDQARSIALLVQVPTGLPSTMLQRRPDVLAAEHTLKAANADIGAARAAFFPSLTLTAATGTASTELSNLFKGSSRTWSFAPSLNLPIFNAGANRASLEAAKVEKQIEIAQYESTLQTAFKEVADALAVRGHINERLDAQQAYTDANQRSLDLAQALYQQGSESFLSVLDAQRSLYSAQQTLISLKLSEQNNRVTLYKVLGGGWG
ncbi:efflux transporter outer membrane subunit [Pseudomonas sp. MAG002Y]|uniref:efflux transporter outer membrane subunit n=1 Tax=Pseudomonas sp. MAG002Y TaxID=2678690 RepID=UPI001C608228|nr:efflux transporter outer membrane subunit [Pseudomonas sp. MAG002Y]MBW5415233.1 efflux transporter outer membrane subunit [Pseudomonas sp. MAG002Y]